MSTPIATASSAGSGAGTAYALRSDIAQFCFPAASRDINRKFAYANSLCFAFLIIGAIGIKTEKIVQKPLPEIVEFIPVIFTPPPEQQQPEPDKPVDEPETPPDPSLDTPVVATVVAANPEAVSFAVPVEGPVILAPLKFAGPPPAVLPRPQAPAPQKPQVTRFDASKATQGSFPKPPYISGTLRGSETALLELDVEVNADGTVAKVEVQKSTGSMELDRKTVQYIKFRWRWEPGESRHFIVPIEFQVR